MSYKTYTFEQNFQRAFNAMYGQQVRQGEEKAKKYAQQQTQNNVDSAIAEEMKSSGISRGEAIMRLYPNE